jgi:protein tyrosine phosphatase (PTP) superfamily phosphohydrolase (DUF442 family)
MAHVRASLGVVLSLGLVAASTTSIGCGGTHGCPVLQALASGSSRAPLPPKCDSHQIVGYRDGLRHVVVQYNDKLFRGGDVLSAKGSKALRQLGVKTIIAVSADDRQRKLAKEYGFDLVEIRFCKNSLTKARLDSFLWTVDHRRGPFYVHCFSGTVRAGILLAHYRVHREGWTTEKALDEYRRLGANYWDSLTLVKVLKENAPA